jgi:phage gpG-like protein
MINVSFVGLSEFLTKLILLPESLNAALINKSEILANTLVQNIRDDKLSGEVLAEKSGLLKDSIDSAVEDTGEGSSASVFVSGDVPYAAILEYGGITKAHIIEATQGKSLAFGWQDKQVFFTHVNHPGSVIAEHSYMRSALDDLEDDITSGFDDALAEATA